MVNENTYEIKNYYLSESENFKIYMLKIFVLISLLTIVLDIWLQNNATLLKYFILEGTAFTILTIIYITFPKYLSLEKAIYSAIVTVTTLIILSLNMQGIDKYFDLFLLAIVPIYSFFFFGAYVGLIWSLSVIFFLMLSMIIALIDNSNTFFTAETIAQIAIGYISLTYLYYRIELRRSAHEQSLVNLVEKKTMLLKEIHHRSKNNLQTVMGLLESQAMKIENEACKKVLTSQRLRLKTMSMVHESLSGTSNYEKIEMQKYLEDIVLYISSFSEHTIDSDFDMISLSMDEGMNIGLFFNEALSNAVEHAYPEGTSNKITVSMKGDSNAFIIKVRDYGKGFDTQKNRNSLGLILMEEICLFFKNSTLSIDVNNGTLLEAQFIIKNN